MNAESRIRELVQANLADNHKVDGVRFLDELLSLTLEVGEVKCTFASDNRLRFQIPSQPPWEVNLGRAKSKLRLLCARLAVLCKETGNQDVSTYGGEGVIEFSAPSDPGDLPSASKVLVTTLERASAKMVKKVAVRFTNTMHTQEFTIANFSV